MLRLELKRRVINFLDTLPAKQYRQIAAKIFSLMQTPEPGDSSHLKGTKDRRVDIGEYRIVYRFNEDTLTVLVVGKRNDSAVYRELKRQL